MRNPVAMTFSIATGLCLLRAVLSRLTDPLIPRPRLFHISDPGVKGVQQPQPCRVKRATVLEHRKTLDMARTFVFSKVGLRTKWLLSYGHSLDLGE